MLQRRAYLPVLAGLVVYFAGLVGAHFSARESPAWAKGLAPLEPCPAAASKRGTPREKRSCKTGDGRGHAEVCDRALTNEMPQRLCDWCNDFIDASRDEQVSKARMDRLEAALNDGSSPFFADARQRFGEERTVHAELEKRATARRLSCLETGTRFGFGIVDVLVAILAVTLLFATARPVVVHPKYDLRAWPKVYAWFVAAGSLATLVTLVGGIFAEPKIWVGLDSYAVSEPTWFLSLVSILGGVLMLTQPVSILWCLSDARFIPPVKPTDPRGDCGVGSYVTFLHVWTMIGAVLAVVPAVFWLRYLASSPLPALNLYLMPALFGLAVVFLLDYRLVRNAIVLRQQYRAALAGLGATTAEVDDKKPAPDPTISFIGEDWWKLPSLLGGVFFAVWAILEWTGAAQTLVNALR